MSPIIIKIILKKKIQASPQLMKSVSGSWACKSALEKCSPGDANAHTHRFREILTYGIKFGLLNVFYKVTP